MIARRVHAAKSGGSRTISHQLFVSANRIFNANIAAANATHTPI
jgi:hypothetical protein